MTNTNKQFSKSDHFFFGKLAEGVFFSSVGLILGRLFGFGTKVILARLGVEDFGRFNFLMAIFNTLVVLFALGVPMAVTRYTSFFLGKKENNKIKDVFLTALATLMPILFLFSILFFILGPVFTQLINKQIPDFYIRFISLIIPLAIVVLLNKAVFLGFLKIKYIFLLENLELLLRFAFIGLFIFLGWGLLGGILGYFLAIFVIFIFSSLAIIKFLKMKNLKFKFFKELWHFSWPVSLSEILSAVTNNLDVLILGWMFSDALVGIYSATVALSGLLLIFPRIILPYFLPVISRWHGQGKNVARIYKKMFFLLLIILIPMTIAIISFGKGMAKIFFGQEYQIDWRVLLLLTLSNLIFALFIWPGRQLLDTLKLTKKNLKLTTIRAVVLISLSFLLIPKINILGAAVAIFIAWSAEAICCTRLVIKNL